MKINKLTPLGAQRKLIQYYDYRPSDFYIDGEEVYLNCKDSVMEKATDIYSELQLRLKEKFEEQTLWY